MMGISIAAAASNANPDRSDLGFFIDESALVTLDAVGAKLADDQGDVWTG
jgi:hypothetical protein